MVARGYIYAPADTFVDEASLGEARDRLAILKIQPKFVGAIQAEARSII
jgi:hypothetical protein